MPARGRPTRGPSATSTATPAGATRPTSAAALAWQPALGAALVAALLYLPALPGGFVRDDLFLIERHPYLRAAGWLPRLLLSDFWAPVSGATRSEERRVGKECRL